jgi:nucleoside-diphosphate-sugar epimerase
MKLVVTGANGFVGAAVVRALEARGEEVHAVVRAASDRRRLAGTSARIVEADFMTDAGRAAIAALGAEVCVHAAWYAEPGKYLAALVNLALMGGTLALARELAHHRCRRFVGVGTCFEYDTARGYLSEDTPLAPAHLYSSAKAGTFLALKQLGALTGLQVAWARLFYLYGRDEYPGRLVPAIARALLRGEEARTTPGAQVRDFLHVDDVGAALAAIAFADVVGAVNVASGVPVTVAAVVREIAGICGRPELVQLGALPYGAGDPMFVCADTRTLAKATAWKPRFGLVEGLIDAIDWWRQSMA